MGGSGVMLVALGTPSVPTAPAVRRFLREFLSDPVVVDAPRLPWRVFLETVILPRRARRVASAYRSIWTPEGSPLLVTTLRQATALEETLARRSGRTIPVAAGMRYGEPSLRRALDTLATAGCRRIAVLPLFPQFSGTTTGSVLARLERLRRSRPGLELATVREYATAPGYVEALAASVREHRRAHGPSRRLLVSFHGIPVRYAERGDPYPAQCRQTAEALASALGLAPDEWAMAYQSRFGRQPWLGPDTFEILESWGREGISPVDVICPGFPADCLETLEEIAVRGRDRYLSAGGGSFRFVPALGDRQDHIEALADLAVRNLGV